MATPSSTGSTPVNASAAAPVAIAPLLVAAAATVAIGMVTRRRDIVRGGARLAAVQLAGATLRSAARRLDQAAVAPPPVVVDAMAVWLAEAAVAAVMARLELPVAGEAAAG